MVRVASAVGISARTRAILPFLVPPTSSASRFCPGSSTCPPLISRSYGIRGSDPRGERFGGDVVFTLDHLLDHEVEAAVLLAVGVVAHLDLQLRHEPPVAQAALVIRAEQL